MTHFVQIVNMDEEKAVRFAFVAKSKAEAFAVALNAVFTAHRVDAVVGIYKAGERCPYGYGKKIEKKDLTAF